MDSPPGHPADTDRPAVEYSVQPSSIDYSGGPDAVSVVTLTVDAANASDHDIDVARLGISIGPLGAGQESLTEDPSTVAVTPGPTTPWAIGGGSLGEWTALPLPPVTSVPAHSTLTFVLADLVVNGTPGTATMVITEVTDRTRTIQLPVTKTEQAPAGSTPVILEFSADPDQVAQHGVSTLRWKVRDATSCVLHPHAIQVEPTGSLSLPVPATTTYVLDAHGTGGSARATAAVVVGPVQVLSFDADVTGPVTRDTPVQLTWNTADALTCSVDQGVGPVPTRGQTTVHPTQTTIYTLTASGLQPQVRALTVTVGADHTTNQLTNETGVQS